MSLLALLTLASVLFATQAAPPSYLAEGDRVEREFRQHRETLDQFFVELRERVARQAPELLPEFQDRPPEAVVYGYQLLPVVVEEFAGETGERILTFSYSWPITRTYVENEVRKLANLRASFDRGTAAPTADSLELFITMYRTLVQNQRTVDGYIQYNRFWQRAIASDRPRFDRLTALYERILAGSAETSKSLQEALGIPEVPGFLEVDRTDTGVMVTLPVYTDIEDEAFLQRVREAVERTWNVSDSQRKFALEVRFQRVNRAQLYPDSDPPQAGAHIDLADHTARFPEDGTVLTTGAEATHALVGRYVALGPAEVSVRVLAHEFGHLLGFRDGYVRGYRDLGGEGFEILELTTAVDDIMSAPREGRVLPSHFELLVDSTEER